MRVLSMIFLASSAFGSEILRTLPVQCAFSIQRNQTELLFCEPPMLSYSYEKSEEPVVCFYGNLKEPGSGSIANSFDLPLDPPYRISIAEEYVKTPRGLIPRLNTGDYCLYFAKSGVLGSPQSGAIPEYMLSSLPVQCYFHIDVDVIRKVACVAAFASGRPGIYREPYVDPPKGTNFPKRVKQ